MARRRTFDGRRVYNESWDRETRDVFFYLLGVAADNYGLMKENPQAIAGEIKLSVPRIRQCIDYLIGEEVLLRYGHNGDTYLAFRKWQDYQKVKYPGAPACPIPSRETMGRLSEKTREHFLRNLGNASNENGRAVAVAVAVAVDSVGKPTVANAKQQAIDYFFKRLQQHSGMESPEFPGGHAAGFFTRRLRKGDTLDDFIETTDEFFDSYIKPEHGIGNFSHYHRVYNKLCERVLKARKKSANR